MHSAVKTILAMQPSHKLLPTNTRILVELPLFRIDPWGAAASGNHAARRNGRAWLRISMEQRPPRNVTNDNASMPNQAGTSIATARRGAEGNLLDTFLTHFGHIPNTFLPLS